MSDTPRTDAAYFKPHATMYDLAGEMKIMERELNSANTIIRQQQLLEQELIDAKGQYAALVADVVLYEDRAERIKRLEEDSQRLNWLLNRGLAWRDCYNDCWIEGEWLYASESALEIIDEAKEAKP